jgi:hypothetical protein
LFGPHNFYGELDVSMRMQRWLKNRCGISYGFRALKPGTAVTITGGAFQGLAGRLHSGMCADERTEVLLD